ncbi:hypothetical protein [Paenibacillus amylolyticus]|uniref:hypothetical protein n=1 Tax=Paenibacillus amylolyticus TaxID=1451 RepID=UPI0039AF5276
MTHSLLHHQQEIKQHILGGIRDNRKLFLIEGLSGTGKSYLTHSIISELSLIDEFEIFLMEGDSQCITRDYYPFERCISSKKSGLKNRNNSKTLKKTVSKASKGIPFVGDLAEHISEEFLNHNDNKFDKDNSYLTDSERSIIYRIRYLTKKRIVFIIENFQFWDEKSVSLIYQILKERENNLSILEELVIIINWTSDQALNNEKFKNEILKEFHFDTYYLNVIEKVGYKSALVSMGLLKEINNDLINGLYSITGGHLHLTKEIIQFFNHSSIESTELISLGNTEKIMTLIEDRLKNLGARGEVISEVLKYASILGISFTFFELEKITKKNQAELQQIITEANKLYFVEENNKKVNFVHEIIRNLFESKLEDKKTYFQAYAECLKVIKPNDYIARARALLKASYVDQAALQYILAYVKKLRNSETINHDFSQEILMSVSELRAAEYVDIMQQAYSDYLNKDFDKVIEELGWIEDSYPILLRAERDYLLAMCLTKKIDSDSRNKSVSILDKYKDINSLDGESELWSRILSLQMISYIHINDKTSAIKNENLLMHYLGDRASYDMDAEDKINILRRKSSAVHSIIFAQRSTMKSVKYFGPLENGGVPLNPIQYYFSLNNHIANTLVLGKFEESFEDATQLRKFIANHKGIPFPRPEIPLNNYILSGIASENISFEKGLEIYNEMFNKIKSSADSILLKINQAVLYAATNQLDHARDILDTLKKKLIRQKNIELYYQFYVDSNLMVVEYLLGNQSEALELWNTISYMPSIGDQNYYEKRHELIKELFDSNIQLSGLEWFTVIDKMYPEFVERSKEKSFGNGFLMSDIQFWSES